MVSEVKDYEFSSWGEYMKQKPVPVFHVLTLQEIIERIDESRKQRDLMYELTPANQMILARRNGTFEAVMTGKGDEKCLIPEMGVVHYLYRGQNEEHVPCVPSLYRGEPTDIDIFIQRMRLTVFRKMLNSHPVVENFFRRHHFLVDEEGLAQHYGLKTEVLDLTSNLNVALFFAVCKYDSTTDTYRYFDDGNVHEGILYVFDPLRDNEPIPMHHIDKYMNGNITPIGLQAFPRPGAQYGYALHIGQGKSTKSWMYRFTFTCEDSKHYYDLFDKGQSLWVKDRIIDKTKQIASQTTFSYGVFSETFEKYRPKGYSRTKLIEALKPFITLQKKVDDVVFSATERDEITKEWNETLGKVMAEKIVRKYWFEYEGITNPEDGKWGQVKGMKNRHEFMTLKHISEYMMMLVIAAPDGPKDAEWKNYMNTPRHATKPRPDDGQWKKIPASMNSVFGKPFLTEDEWRI